MAGTAPTDGEAAASDEAAAHQAQHEETEQVRVRKEKLARIRELGINPYPVRAPRTATWPPTSAPGRWSAWSGG